MMMMRIMMIDEIQKMGNDDGVPTGLSMRSAKLPPSLSSVGLFIVVPYPKSTTSFNSWPVWSGRLTASTVDA